MLVSSSEKEIETLHGTIQVAFLTRKRLVAVFSSLPHFCSRRVIIHPFLNRLYPALHDLWIFYTTWRFHDDFRWPFYRIMVCFEDGQIPEITEIRG